ncbi:hypothetical protein XENOCAPTIV_026680 [Xenoophorus captivus]|uniref:Secreted protein n=1 Tax=Xenoophorus captivus TaxID=1517983 RepID=A0ABV0RW14_9TELE
MVLGAGGGWRSLCCFTMLHQSVIKCSYLEAMQGGLISQQALTSNSVTSSSRPLTYMFCFSFLQRLFFFIVISCPESLLFSVFQLLKAITLEKNLKMLCKICLLN